MTCEANKCPMDTASENHRAFQHNGMYEFFRDLRAREIPIFYSPKIGYWVLTRRQDVLCVFKDPDRFSAAIATQPLFPWPPSVMELLKSRGLEIEPTQVNSDAPRHGRLKGQSSKFLNIKRLSSYEPEIRVLARSYIDQMKGRETVDLVDALTYELPAQVVFLLYGVTDFDPRKIKSWGDLRIMMMFGNLSHEELDKAAHDLADFWDFTVDLFEARKAEPRDDYPSMLAETLKQDESPLTENEIKNMLFGILLAGHETTTNAAGNLFLELLRHRDQWKKLVADPALIRNAVEEGLRYASSVVAWRRTAKEDIEVGGVTIKKGDKILMSLGSANRDEAYFENGEAFDIERANARQHIAFGTGMHHCAGAPLARLELRIMLEEMVAAFPRMELVEDQEFAFTPTATFRGPEKLWVRLNS